MLGAEVEMDGGGVTVRPIERLSWIPLLVDVLEESGAWEEMQDYQFGWYMKLLVKLTRSARLGYLRLDREKLWQLAGARSKRFFEQENAVVMARFKVRDFDGQDWIYSARMLSVLEEQTEKYYRKKPPRNSASKSVSDLNLDSKEIKEDLRPELPYNIERRNELERNDDIARAKARGFILREDGSCYRAG
jgi:hypothetical protein